MTGTAARLSPAMLARLPGEGGAVLLSAHLVDRLEPELSQPLRWPWRFAALAAAVHLALAALVLLAGRVHLPAPPPEPITISVVSETTPQGADVPQPALQPQPVPQPAPAAQPLPAPPQPTPRPLPPAPLSTAALPPPPPPAPPAPQERPVPKLAAQAARGAKIKADKMASVTVAVMHPAVPFADNQAPDYPQSAIAAGEKGVVRFTLYLTADGRVRSILLTQSSGYADLDASVRAAAMGWRYQPAMRGGVAVPSVVQFHVQFEPN